MSWPKRPAESSAWEPLDTKVAALARAFGCRVIYHSMSGCVRPEPYEQVDFEEHAVSQADILSVHAPLTEATRGLMDREAFRRMKPGSIFLNLARGAIVR